MWVFMLYTGREAREDYQMIDSIALCRFFETGSLMEPRARLVTISHSNPPISAHKRTQVAGMCVTLYVRAEELKQEHYITNTLSSWASSSAWDLDVWSHCSSSCSQWALMFRVYTWDIHLGFSLSTWMTSALGGPGDFPVGWPVSRGRHSDYSFQIQMVTHRMHLKGSVERHTSKNPPEFLLVLSEMQLLSLPHRDFFSYPF